MGALPNRAQDAHNYGAWAKLYAIYGERYTFSREVTGRTPDGRLQYKCVGDGSFFSGSVGLQCKYVRVHQCWCLSTCTCWWGHGLEGSLAQRLIALWSLAYDRDPMAMILTCESVYRQHQ
eukprot:1157727-Pelagomonas_calceolata.AAC.4